MMKAPLKKDVVRLQPNYKQDETGGDSCFIFLHHLTPKTYHIYKWITSSGHTPVTSWVLNQIISLLCLHVLLFLWMEIHNSEHIEEHAGACMLFLHPYISVNESEAPGGQRESDRFRLHRDVEREAWIIYKRRAREAVRKMILKRGDWL